MAENIDRLLSMVSEIALVLILFGISATSLMTFYSSINELEITSQDKAISEDISMYDHSFTVEATDVILTILNNENECQYHLYYASGNPLGDFDGDTVLKDLAIIDRSKVFSKSYTYNQYGEVSAIIYKEE